MASRREQLEAYTFARRRMVAGFLQAEPGGGSEEKAPRPFRAILPGIVVGALILTGFGVYGLIRPGVPPGWKNKGSLIVGRDSASRYVYIDGKLHPVLNIASGRLLLDPGKFKVNMVPEKAINQVDRGAPLGIPGAPDRLPSAKEVSKTKSWTVCERAPLTADGKKFDTNGGPQRSVFIGAAPTMGVLGPAEALFVRYLPENKPEEVYLVEGGRRYLVKSTRALNALEITRFPPQRVSKEWLDTLEPGVDIDVPEVPNYGKPSNAALQRKELATVGLVLRVQGSDQYYVVLQDAVVPISRLVAELLTVHPDAKTAYGTGTAGKLPVTLSDLGTSVRPGAMFAADKGWPEELPIVVNRVDGDPGVGRTTLCNTYTGNYVGGVAQTTQSAWTELPARLVDGMGGVYVEPGAGALIREVTGRADDPTGTLFLIADSGLRYQIVNDPPKSGGGTTPAGEDSEAKIRLGYKGVVPAPVPRAWAGLVPTGVQLSRVDAEKPQPS